MKKYTLKRILTSLFTLLAILLVLFILMQLMPGSPFNDEKLISGACSISDGVLSDSGRRMQRDTVLL